MRSRRSTQRWECTSALWPMIEDVLIPWPLRTPSFLGRSPISHDPSSVCIDCAQTKIAWTPKSTKGSSNSRFTIATAVLYSWKPPQPLLSINTFKWSFFSKSPEKCVSVQLIHYIDLHSLIIPPLQSGFGKFHSTKCLMVILLADVGYPASWS